jgi:hypothetical protein
MGYNTYMHGNTWKFPVSLSVFLSQTSKNAMFLFLSFLFCKIGEQECGTGPVQVGRVGTSGRGQVVGKGGRRANSVQKMCTRACKCKNDAC